MRGGKKFSKILISSDFDSTFFENGYIPERNISATKYFMENGGAFTINTARPVNSLGSFMHLFTINAPASLSNGGVIYDYQKQQVLFVSYLPLLALTVAKEVYEKFDTVRIELFTLMNVGIARDLPILDEQIQNSRPQGEIVDIYSFDEPITRIVYLAEKETITQIADYVMKRSGGEYDEIRFNNNFYNVMPKGITKGGALIRIAGILDIPIENTYCIGDSYNDIGMMKAAGTSVCPQNAEQDLKNLSDIVVCDMMDGAVADLIEYIDRRTGG